MENESTHRLEQKQKSTQHINPLLPCEKVVLFLGGAFNPPHLAHLAAMECAREALEKRGIQVVTGYFAAATDGYVKQKMAKSGQLAMRSQHRLELCNQLVSQSGWMRPTHKVYGSAQMCANEMLPQLAGNAWKSIGAGIVVGADRAISKSGRTKWQHNDEKKKLSNKFFTLKICIARGEDSQRVLDALKSDRLLTEADTIAKAGFLFLHSEKVDAISSTLVRAHILKLRELINSNGSSSEKEKDIDVCKCRITSELKLLPPPLLEYILMLSEKELYFEPVAKQIATTTQNADEDD